MPASPETPPAAPQPAAPLHGELPRVVALAILAALTGVCLVLGLPDLAHGLPYVFHADDVQIGQAVRLLRDGWFAEDSVYPTPLVWLYAAAAWAAHALGALGSGGESFDAFAARFADPAVHHLLGRFVDVLCAALLVPATYRLARVRLSRGAALLAAAVVAVDPVLMLTARQVRPHAPAVLLMVLAAPSVLRLAWPRRAAHGATDAPASHRGATRRDSTRRDGSAGPWHGVVAGALIGACTAAFQVAAPLVVAALACIAAGVRPARRALATAGALLASMAAGDWLVTTLARAPAAVRPLTGASTGATSHVAGMLEQFRNWASAVRFSNAGSGWLGAEPALFAGVVGAVLLAWRARSRRAAAPGTAARGPGPAPLDLLMYGVFPATVLACTAVLLGAHVRYVVTALPFLAALAAAACLAVRPAALRVALAALLIGVPLATSLRVRALQRTVDTRLALDALLDGINARTDEPVVIALHGSLALDRLALPRGAIEFPPAPDDLSHWDGTALEPRAALHASAAAVYLRVPGTAWAGGPLDAASLEQLGFRRWGTLGDAPTSRLYLPDVPDALALAAWRTAREGPPIELWLADSDAGRFARSRLARLVTPAHVAAFTGLPGPTAEGSARGAPAADPAEAAVAAALARADARRAEAARRASATDIGTGAGTIGATDAAGAGNTAAGAAGPAGAAVTAGAGVSSGATDAAAGARNSSAGALRPPPVDEAQRARLLALPSDRWRDAGGGLAPEGGAAPVLSARGTLRNGEPVMLLVEGAPPGSRAYLVLGVHEVNAMFRGGLLVPKPERIIRRLVIGADGSIALAAMWPRDTPARLPIFAQVWIEDDTGPRGFLSTNAVAGTTPD